MADPVPPRQQATCPTCGGVVAGLLAMCTRTAACIRAEIAADVAFERSQDR